MKKTLLLSVGIMTLVFTACNKNEYDITPDNSNATIKAVMEVEETKSTVSDYSFYWSTNDEISVWYKSADGNSARRVPFTLSGNGGVTSGTFTGTIIEGETCMGYAVYPSGDHSLTEETITVNFPSSYGDHNTDYVENTNAVMIASPSSSAATVETESNVPYLSFKHVGGVLAFTIKNVPIGVNQFVFTANMPITGEFEVKNGKITTTSDENAAVENNTVSIQFKELTAPKDAMTFYVPLPTGTYEGFKIEVKTSNGSSVLEYGTNTVNTLSRAGLAYLPAFIIDEVNGGMPAQEISTLTQLQNAFVNGGNYLVTTDLSVSELSLGQGTNTSLTLNDDVTLTVGAPTVKSSSSVKYGIINKGELTIKGGNVEGDVTSSTIYNMGILTIEGTNITSPNYCVYTVGNWDNSKKLEAQGEPTVKTTITGGKITSNWVHNGSNTHTYALYCSDNAMLSVNDASVEGDGAIFVTCANVNLDNVTTKVNCTTSAAVDLYLEAAANATVINCAPSIVRAYDKWNNQYGVITYNNNVMTNATQAQQMIVPKGVQVTLEGNDTYGKPVLNGQVVNNGNLTLTNVTVNYTGSTGSAITNNGILTLKSADVTSSAYCVYTVGKWDDTKTLADQGSPIVKTTITGGTISSNWSHTDDTHTYALYCSDNALLTVKDATVNGDGSIFVTCANVNLDNVTATANCNKKSACNLYLEAAANATVSDCKFSSTGSNVRAYDNWNKKYGVITYNNTKYCTNAITEHPTGGYTTATTN